MTVLVVVRKNDQACIASDTQSNQGNIIMSGDNQINPSKIHLFKGSYIGISGNVAHHRVFRSIIKHYPDRLNFDGADNIFETFRGLQTILKDEYYLLPQEDDEQPYESNQMFGVICNQTGIYHFQSYREVNEIKQYWSSGSGSDIALGALYASYQLLEDVEQIAKIAIYAACKLDDSCGLPMESHVVQLKTR